MIPSEMLTLLGYRLEDPEGDIYDNTLKILMINRAQARVYTELNPHIIPELREKQSDLSLDNEGAFASGDLSSTVLGGLSGGVIDIQLLESENRFSRKISFEEYSEFVNRSVTYSTWNPKHYYYGTKAYELPFVSTLLVNTDEFISDSYYYIKTFQTGDDFTNIGGSNVSGTRFKATSSAAATTFTTSVVYLVSGVNVFYKKQPTQITVGGYAAETFSPESELVHDAVAFYAESLCWKVNRDPRASDALQEAAALIETLNSSISATDSNDAHQSDEQMLSADYILPIGTNE